MTCFLKLIDTDVLKVIAISLGSVVVCVIALWLLAVRCSGWRKTQGKRKQLQRPFVTKRISLTPRDDSPTFRYVSCVCILITEKLCIEFSEETYK